MGIGGAHSGGTVRTGFSLSRVVGTRFSVSAGFALSATARACLNAAMALVIAPACAACRAVLDRPASGPVCDACWQAITPLPLLWRPDSPTSLDGVWSAGSYDGRLRDIIHAWKFERRQGLARPLARLVREHCAPALQDADLLVAVPMTPWRKWHRGFNQAEDLVRCLGLRSARVLARWRPRPAQSTLPSSRRRINLEASIFVPVWRRRAVQGRSIVLVDDVVTTGATLEACASALRDAGARHVRAVTLARTLLKSARAA
jgi:ComF family protein